MNKIAPQINIPKDNHPKEYNTLKRSRLLKELPQAKTIMQAGKQAGYTSQQIYRKSIKRHIAQKLQAMGYDEASIKAEFERLSALAEKKNDLSNAMRGKENIARIMGLYKDKLEQNISTKTDDLLAKHGLNRIINDTIKTNILSNI